MDIEHEYNKIKNKGKSNSNISEYLFTEDEAPYFRFYNCVEGKRKEIITYEQAIEECDSDEDIIELMKECVKIGKFGCVVDW